MFQRQKLINIMRENRIKGKELAKELKVQPPTISSWRNGKKTPTIENIEKMAIFFKVKMEYFTEKEEEKLTINQENVINNKTNIAYKIETNEKLNENENELINIYRKLNKRNQLKLMDKAYELEEEN